MFEEDIFPPDLRHHPKMGIDLQPPAEDHWNIASDTIFPASLRESQQQWEAKELAKAQAEASHPEETANRAPADAPRSQDSNRVLPIETAPSREQVMKTIWSILNQVHALCLQSMHELGSI